MHFLSAASILLPLQKPFTVGKVVKRSDVSEFYFEKDVTVEIILARQNKSISFFEHFN